MLFVRGFRFVDFLEILADTEFETFGYIVAVDQGFELLFESAFFGDIRATRDAAAAFSRFQTAGRRSIGVLATFDFGHVAIVFELIPFLATSCVASGSGIAATGLIAL